MQLLGKGGVANGWIRIVHGWARYINTHLN